MQTAVFPTLLKKQLASGKTVTLEVTSNSMRPLIKARNMVEIAHHPIEALKVGDIITVWHEGGFLTHRLIEVDFLQEQLALRGEWHRQMETAVSFTNYLGKVITISKTNRTIILSRPIGNIICRLLFLCGKLRRNLRKNL